MENPYFIIRLSASPRELAGPLSVQAVFESLQKKELSWTDIGYQPGQEWKRLYEFSQLRLLMEDLPPAEKLEKYTQICLKHLEQNEPTQKVRKPSESWPVMGKVSGAPSALTFPPRYSPVYLSIAGVQHGPMNGDEARKMLVEMKSRDQVYLWYRGLATWLPVQELPEFADLKPSPSTVKKLPEEVSRSIFNRENRSSNRKGIVATIREVRGKGRYGSQGVAMDVSPSGLQIRLEGLCPYSMGDIAEFELIPLSILGLSNIRFTAKTMWVKRDEGRLGLEFLQFKGDGRERLEKFLRRLDAGVA